MGYELGDLLGGVAGEVVQDGLVGVAGDAGVGVAEGFGDDFDVDPGCEHQRGGDVAQVVKADRWQAGGFHEALEEVADLTGVEEGAVFLGEDLAGLLPALAPGFPFLPLAGFVGEQELVGLVVEGDQADAAVGFGLSVLGAPS